jgi:anti-sigma B factor antagonist
LPETTASIQLLDEVPAGRPSALQTQCVVSAGWRTLRLAGELDIASAPDVEAALHSACAGPAGSGVVIDLRKVEFMDSTGLRLILMAKELCADAGTELRVIPGPPQVQRLFEVTGLVDQLHFGTPRGGTGS